MHKINILNEKNFKPIFHYSNCDPPARAFLQWQAGRSVFHRGLPSEIQSQFHWGALVANIFGSLRAVGLRVGGRFIRLRVKD